MTSVPEILSVPVTVPLLVVIGICLASGIHHVFVAFRREEGATNFAFAIFCFTIALYTASNIGLYSVSNAELYRFYVKLQIGLAFATGLSMVLFVSLYTSVVPKLILAVMFAYGFGLLAYHISLPYGLFFESFEGIGSIRLEWGGTVQFPLVEYADQRTRLGDLNVLSQVLFMTAALVIQYRRGEQRAALMLGFCLAIYFGCSVYDVALARNILIDRPEVISRIPIQEYGFVSLVLLMSIRLSNDVLKAAEIKKALIENEENQRITLDSIGDAVISTDAKGRVLRMNPVAVSLTGWTEEEATGRFLPEVFRIVNSRTREVVPNPAEKVLQTGGLVGLANHTVLIHRDGSERQIADSGAPIRSTSGEIVGVVLVFRDVTRQYLLEDQLRHSQKMEAVGRLAGGVAHDFNNLLQAIQGYTSLALSQVEDRGRVKNDLREVLKTADRATVLVRQLLTFSRRESYKARVLDLNAMIKDLVKLLQRVIGIDTQLDLDLENGLRPVLADRGQIEQVLMNLCVNARDAMPERGVIGISTRNVVLDEAFCLDRGSLQPGEYVQISIMDSGIGMAPELQQRIFEPYFTTKQKGEGTGLGLATVFAIVERHEGMIEVKSAPSQGSTFSVYLAAASRDAKHDTQTGKIDPPPRGSGLILVAEDEEVVRNLAVYALESAGYEVIAAEDGAIAKGIFDQRASEIDVAVLDLMMPNLGGRALYDHIRLTHPTLPVIFSSGFTPEGLDSLLEHDSRALLLQKPHSTGDLLRAIQTFLQEAAKA